MNTNTESMYNRFVVIGKHISIHEDFILGGKTTRYIIMDRRYFEIGCVRWYGPWKQWCFRPREGTFWSDDCLQDIIPLIKTLNAGETPKLMPHGERLLREAAERKESVK